jgi:hypothetical protein
MLAISSEPKAIWSIKHLVVRESGTQNTKQYAIDPYQTRQMVKLCILLLFSLLLPGVLRGQEVSHQDPSATLSLQVEPESNRPPRQPPNSISQELDSYIKSTASVKPNPLLHVSLFDLFPDKVTDVARSLFEWESLKLGLTYTLLNQYAVDTPPGVRHNQASGRFDLSGAMPLYEGESTAGSFSLRCEAARISASASSSI